MCQDHSHNKVMEGQINSFRAQPLAGSSRDMHRGTCKGQASQLGSGAGGLQWSTGGAMEAKPWA